MRSLHQSCLVLWEMRWPRANARKTRDMKTGRRWTSSSPQRGNVINTPWKHAPNHQEHFLKIWEKNFIFEFESRPIHIMDGKKIHQIFYCVLVESLLNEYIRTCMLWVHIAAHWFPEVWGKTNLQAPWYMRPRADCPWCHPPLWAALWVTQVYLNCQLHESLISFSGLIRLDVNFLSQSPNTNTT